MFIRESSHGRGSSCMVVPKRPWAIELLMCEELPVSEAIPQVHAAGELRHVSLVGLCKRMPSKLFFE